MNTHRPVIEVGPGAVRRLCCGTGEVADAEAIAAALESIDDPVALLDGRPVAVDSLWCQVLRSLMGGHRAGMLVVYPSWWSVMRVGIISTAAETVAKDAVLQPRSWLLKRAVPDAAPEATVMVEIADWIVVVSGVEVVAVSRRAQPRGVVEEVVGAVAAMTVSNGATVLIDVPSTVAGAAVLATAIAATLLASGQPVRRIDDARLAGLVRSRLASAGPARPRPSTRAAPPGARRLARFAAAGVVVAIPAVAGLGQHHALGQHHGRPVPIAPTTFLVEGRVALTVPAGWPTQRVVAGPGSARVLLASPSDPEVALHITQSPVAGETLPETAERLQRAMAAEPAGIFVDFNPVDRGAGRPAVTYREVRADHEVRWTVLLDGEVRIGIGCQNRPGARDAVGDVCEQAVRSVHSIG